jgi:hypothetical protein
MQGRTYACCTVVSNPVTSLVTHPCDASDTPVAICCDNSLWHPRDPCNIPVKIRSWCITEIEVIPTPVYHCPNMLGQQGAASPSVHVDIHGWIKRGGIAVTEGSRACCVQLSHQYDTLMEQQRQRTSTPVLTIEAHTYIVFISCILIPNRLFCMHMMSALFAICQLHGDALEHRCLPTEQTRASQ